MSAPAIISGDLTTFKHVPTRKVYQLIVEIPAEAASAAFATLGMPGTVSQIPVAVARLVDDARVKPEQTKERRSFTELPMSPQAAMRCQEPSFWEFLQSFSPRFWTEMLRKYGSGASAAAAIVRQRCGVESRSEIRAGHTSGDEWATFEAEFYAWQRGRR